MELWIRFAKYKLDNVIVKKTHMDDSAMNANPDTGIFRIANLANVTDMPLPAMLKLENVLIVSNTQPDFTVKNAKTVTTEFRL